jgi:hypothetical protein
LYLSAGKRPPEGEVQGWKYPTSAVGIGLLTFSETSNLIYLTKMGLEMKNKM